ncbi:MAG: TolC family protein [Verrucomicrobiales bacterium]|jgi:outer membrane protein TolC|nr:TolC family protein [Verrucomicrobiales bacterium]
MRETESERLESFPDEGNRCRWGKVSLIVVSIVVFLSGCSPDIYQTRADTEAYATIFRKTPDVENVENVDVDLATPAPVDLSNLSLSSDGADYLGKVAKYESGAKVLQLDDALETGITYGREYLNEKERVFLSALDLTLARFRLSPIFFAEGGLDWASDSRTAQFRQGATDLVATNTFARTGSGGFNWLYRTGARVSADFTRDFLRFTTGNRSVNASDLAVSIVQPLLQGGGTTVTMEALTQEERNLLYDLRDFADFRRFFVVDIVSEYYEVLQAKDQVKNNYAAYSGFLKSVEREEGLAVEGLRTQTQLGRLRQAALQAESRWIDSVRRYQTRLDQLKITLGVPVEDKIILDDRELARLRIDDPDITREEAVKIALVTRPDLATTADRIEDAERQIKVAKNGLLPGLDVSMDYNPRSDPGDTTPGINWDRRRWETSLDLDLPLDRKAERNIYRASLIFLERAKRADELARDEARLDIYDGWRAIEQAKLNFKVAELQVEVANRRLEEQILLAELGRGDAQDLVDAQNDLLSAQNQRTSTVVSHTLARLRLWRDMGILYIREDGTWVKKLRNEPR